MTIQVQNVTQSTDTFGQWLSKTNQVITAVNTYSVTVNSNTAVGNAAITGKFSANTFVTSNVGSFQVGTSSSNAVINATAMKMQTSPTSNLIMTTSGMLINGNVQYAATIMSLGNTTIRGSNVSSNNLYLTTFANVGNTFLTRTSAYADSMNTKVFYATANATFGDNEANTYIDRFGIVVYSSPTGAYVVNSNITSTTMWTVDSYANLFHGNIVPPPGQNTILFLANTHFEGQNNYFDYGLTSNGNIDIYGPGLHYLHSWNYKTSDWPTANATFVYEGKSGSANFSRNLSQDNQGNLLITQNAGELLRMVDGTLYYITFVNGTPGAAIYTPRIPFTVNNAVANVSSNITNVVSPNTNFGNASTPVSVGIWGAPTVYRTTAGANRIAYYGGSAADLAYTADIDPEAGLTNYTLRMDGGQFQFAFSTSATAYDFGTAKAYIDHSGNLYVTGGIGINKTPGSVGTLAMTGDILNDGNINSRGNITAYYTSDRSLKTNVTNITNALEKVKKINGVEFDWTDEHIAKNGGVDNYFNRKHDVGVIAQEIEAVLPEVVAMKDDGTKAVRYEKIVALLIEAVKELSAEVDELKKRG
jgi:Chaperone of endosialidase